MTNLVQKDVEQIIPLVLAKAGYDRRRLESGEQAEQAFVSLVQVLEQGISLCRTASPDGDPRLRLEKHLSEIYLRLADHPDGALELWQGTTKVYKQSYLAWTLYAEVLIKQDKHSVARTLFSDLSLKRLDWPEAIWEAWIAFEHLYGNTEELETCLDKVERARIAVENRRTKEAEKVAWQNAQLVAEQQAATVPVTAVARSAVHDSQVMEVDVSMVDVGTKRKANDEVTGVESSKRAKLEQIPAPLKRDRENSTVFVADLGTGTTESELSDLFKDCGTVREVKLTQLPSALVATVEFMERESIPAALTKDKKRIRGEEIAVHMAWRSTLYVTNFAESTDDASVREMFGEFGTIFDVRWPSKKFKNTRRFCYVQFISPSAAESALSLNGTELSPGITMSVLISNPERKKERTDADANDREVYVAGLSKFTSKTDLEKLFKTYGAVKEVRMTLDDDGNSRGFAFIEFELEKAAQAALAANNHELKKRNIAVTLSNSRVKAKNKNIASDTGLGQRAETRSRSVRVRNLPPGTQEGLLQQTLEKLASVKRVEVFTEEREALVELENAAEAGKLLLRTEPFIFLEHTLTLTEETEGSASRPGAPPTAAGGLFVPRRAAASKPRAGLGHTKKLGTGRGANAVISGSGTSSGAAKAGKGQNDFRKMLG